MFSTSKFVRQFWIVVQLVSSIAMIVLIKNMLASGMAPLIMTTEMMLSGGAILLILLILRREKINKREIIQIFPAGVVGGCLAFWIGFIGLSMTQASNYAFLTRFTVVFTCLLSYFILREKWTVNKTIVIILIMFGSFLMSGSGSIMAIGKGDLIVVLSSLLYSLSYVLVAKAMRQVSALAAATYRSLIGGLALLILCIASSQTLIIPDVKILIAGILVALAVLSAHKIIRIVNASYMVLITSVIPVMTAIIMIIFFGEKLSGWQLLGGSTILFGSWLTSVESS